MPYAESAGSRIHYEVVDLVVPWETRRETIVFHHGIGADPGIWGEWLPRLADRYRLVTFDMRGYGRSGMPAADFRWTMDLLSSDLLAVADAVRAERVHLVGESLGGTVALYCATRNARRVATVMVSNGAHLGASIQRAEAWRAMIDDEGIEAWSDAFMRDRFYDDALDAAKRAWFARCQEAWPRDSILNALSVLIGTDLRPQLPGLRCPVLLLHGDSSPYIPVEVMADLHSRLPDSRLQVFARARHGLPFSHAADCAQALRKFLDEVGAADLQRNS